MEPRTILIKPSYLPALPAYEGTMRRIRILVLALPFYAAFIVATFLYLGVHMIGVAVMAILAVSSIGYLMWSFTRRRARNLAEMAGEQAIVVAGEIDGGFELRPGGPRRRGITLPVFPGDTITVTVARARDPRKGSARLLPFMEWRFDNADFQPLVVGTYFDADRALLRDVETRLKGLGATVAITHVPFDDAR